MADFVTTKGAAHHLEQIICGAREKLVLISPYLRLSEEFLQRLKDAERRGVRVTVVYGKEELRSDEQAKLALISTLHAMFLPNLHAKCYFNESEMVITSMNMYEASEANREMGVHLVAGEAAFEAALREADSIIAAATSREFGLPKAARQPPRDVTTPPEQHRSRGFCIRCGHGIFLNPSRPLCVDCFQVWAIFGNEDYQERQCHDCGRDADTSMRRPLCDSCFASAQRRHRSDGGDPFTRPPLA